jgi:hypothetical protein
LPEKEVRCCFRINDPAIKHTLPATQHAPFLMPVLNPWTVTPRLYRTRATSWRNCFDTPLRWRHDTAAADSVHGQANLEHHVNEYAPPLRARKHGFKSLPMSPLMREEYAKGPPRQVEPQQDVLEDFRKEVAMNPYGRHVLLFYLSRKVLTLPPSTSSSDAYSTLRPYARAPTFPLPPPFRNNAREITGCHELSTT